MVQRTKSRSFLIEYADAVEDLDDGEAFLMTDWSEHSARAVPQKETFDAGATPGLDDFERPDLKSVTATSSPTWRLSARTGETGEPHRRPQTGNRQEGRADRSNGS